VARCLFEADAGEAQVCHHVIEPLEEIGVQSAPRGLLCGRTLDRIDQCRILGRGRTTFVQEAWVRFGIGNDTLGLGLETVQLFEGLHVARKNDLPRLLIRLEKVVDGPHAILLVLNGARFQECARDWDLRRSLCDRRALPQRALEPGDQG
jgi:hypothetical protein